MQSRLVALTILASIGFFNYHGMFPLSAQRAMFMIMVIVCAVVAFGVRNNNIRIRDLKFPIWPWIIFTLGIIVSAFVCPFYHQQTLTQTLITHSTYLFVPVYFFILIKLNPDPKQLFKWFIVLWIGAALTYLVNFVTFPHNMFGEKLDGDFSRGMLRMFPQLFYLIILLIFWAINCWQITKKNIYLLFAAMGYILILMSLTRQSIAIVSLLSFLQLLSGVSWVKKVLLGIVIMGVGTLIVINLPMYKDMKELTETQIEDNSSGKKEDVRVGAWRYFAYEGSEDAVVWLLGNGTPSSGNSVWGKLMDGHCEETGYLFADVALASVIFQYGLIAAIALMVVLFMAALKPKSPNKRYLTYFMFSIILHGIASGIFFFYYEMLIVVLGLYLIYRPDTKIDTIVDKVNSGTMLKKRRFLLDY